MKRRCVELRETGTGDDVAAGVAEQEEVRGGAAGHREAGGVDIFEAVGAVVVIDGVAGGDAVRVVPGVGSPFAERVAADERGKGSAGALLVDPAELPAVPADAAKTVEVEGERASNHFGFSDDGALLKSPILIIALHMLGIMYIDGRRQLSVTAHSISTFFDVYLKDARVSELRASRVVPEVEDAIKVGDGIIRNFLRQYSEVDFPAHRGLGFRKVGEPM